MSELRKAEYIAKHGEDAYKKKLALKRERAKHQAQYRSLKKIIAPESELHHEWIRDTTGYRGVALVDADAHRHGIIDVIAILDGEITLLTEANQKRKERKI